MTVLLHSSQSGLSTQSGNKKYTFQRKRTAYNTQNQVNTFFNNFKHIYYLLRGKFVTELKTKSVSLFIAN